MAITEGLQACTGCGVAVAPANVLYTSDARVVCAKCYAQADIVETDRRHARVIRNAGLASLGGGVFTFFSPLSGLLVVVIAAGVFAIATGIYALGQVSAGNDRFTRHLTSGDRTLVWVTAIAGMAIAALVVMGVFAGMSISIVR
jgi:uncharacterized membrane protein HdeD (DUF308 family)